MTKKKLLKSLKAWHGKLTLDDQADLLLAMFDAEKKEYRYWIDALKKELDDTREDL